MEYNSNTDLSYSTAAGTCNSSCHDNTGAYAALNASTIFTPHLGLNGAGAACTTCHGAETGGQAGRLWPDNVANNPSRSAYADDDIGAHDNHITAIGQYLGYGDWTVSMYSQSNQITICAFCHPSPGGTGHATNDGTDLGGTGRASVFNTTDGGEFSRFTETAGGTGVDSGTDFSYTNSNCSNLVCHNQTTTPVAGWATPPAADCTTLCHPTGGYTNRHDTHVTAESYLCTECHDDNGTTAFAHQDGAVGLTWNNAGRFELLYGDSDGGYSQAAPLAYKDGTWGTCSSAACHNNLTSPDLGHGHEHSVTAVSICHTEDGSNGSSAAGGSRQRRAPGQPHVTPDDGGSRRHCSGARTPTDVPPVTVDPSRLGCGCAQ